MRYIDPDGNDWKDAYPHLENAISANVSIGWRLSANFQVWGAKVGIDADAGSTGSDLGDELDGGIDDLSADNKDDKSKEKPAEESDKKPNPADENSDNADKTEKK